MNSRSFCHIYGQFGPTGDRIAEELEHLFALGLVCDAEVSLHQLDKYRNVLQELQRRGGLVAPTIYPSSLDANSREVNWWNLNQEECEHYLRLAQKRFAACGFDSLPAITTYTPGNAFVEACRKLGIRFILGFVAPTVGEDGDWKVSDYGAPLSPYFVSSEDFRKPEPAGARADQVLMASMELRNPLVCLRHWNEGPFCPLNALAGDRWLEPTDQPLPFLAMAEDWLRQTEMDGETRFFHINLQYFFAGRCWEHNRRALEWIADERDRGRLEAGSILSWEKRLKAQGGFARQTTYWRGEMMGYTVGHRPGSYPDVVVDEREQGQVVWQFPRPLPARSYDYTVPWDYPPFVPDGSAPESLDYEGIEVSVSMEPDAGASSGAKIRRAVVSITNSREQAVNQPPVPIALWTLLEGCSGPFEAEASGGWAVRVAPHPGGTGGAVLLHGPVPPGQSCLEVTVRFGAENRQPCVKRWGALLEAQTFRKGHQVYTTLAAQTPDRFSITARVQLSRPAHPVQPVRVESLCGLDYHSRDMEGSGLPLLFDGSRLACWHRFWGVTADELEIEGVEEIEAGLKRRTRQLADGLTPGLSIPAPGYQLFGDVTEPSRWDRALGREAGKRELEKIREWFHERRPDVGERVIEAHPGIYLPRGSVTHALAHEFDFVECKEGYALHEGGVDYAQGWDWGVAAWVQWRWFKITLEGIRDTTGSHTLHLHAFDPECRDSAVRVHFRNPANPTAPDFCVVAWWNLPQGLEGRWQDGALCSIPVPAECREWPAVDVWINPLEKIKLHDWIAEGGSPGMLSHLWLTRK